MRIKINLAFQFFSLSSSLFAMAPDGVDSAAASAQLSSASDEDPQDPDSRIARMYVGVISSEMAELEQEKRQAIARQRALETPEEKERRLKAEKEIELKEKVRAEESDKARPDVPDWW